MKQTLTATLPDGTTTKRTTDHPYKFVVVAEYEETNYWRKVKGLLWGDLRWTERRDLAEKAATKFQNCGAFPKVAIVEVNAETK